MTSVVAMDTSALVKDINVLWQNMHILVLSRFLLSGIISVTMILPMKGVHGAVLRIALHVGRSCSAFITAGRK